MDIVTYALLKKKITSALTGIAEIKSDENGKLVFVTNDGDTFTIDIPGGALPEDLTVSNGVGKAEVGTKYEAGTALADIVIDMLSIYKAPSITISTNLTNEVLDVKESLEKIKITVKVTKGSKDINSIKLFIGGEEIDTYTNVTEGGTFVTEYTFDPAVNKTFTIKATVNDGVNTSQTKQITFIGKSYWGFVDESVTQPTENDVLNLQNSVVKNSKTLIYSEIKIEYGKILYAYPKSLGALSKIVDNDDRNYTNSYTKSEVEVDGIPYFCYLLTKAMGTDNGYQKYS